MGARSTVRLIERVAFIAMAGLVALSCPAACGGKTLDFQRRDSGKTPGGDVTLGSDGVAPEPARCGGKVCATGLACCLLDGTCFDPSDPNACPIPAPDPAAPAGTRPCGSNTQCAAGESCVAANALLCLGPGHCQPLDICASDADITCGCDGNTYTSGRSACSAGVRVNGFHHGGCGDAYIVVAGGTSMGVTVTACGDDSQCPSGQRCCAITGLCYDPAQTGACAMPPAGTWFPCAGDAICSIVPYSYCQGVGCGTPGGCVSAFGSNCGIVLDPVCGCDGTTYTSADCAAKSAVRVAHTGPCTDAG